MRLQTLLLSAFLVVATASAFRIGRSANGSSRIVHTNARYNETIHSKPVLVYENMDSLLKRACSNYIEVMNNTKYNRGKGMLNSIAVPTCRPELTPCPYGSDGNKLHLTGIKTNRTDELPFWNKDNETVLISVTHEVDDVCACMHSSAESTANKKASEKGTCYKKVNSFSTPPTSMHHKKEPNNGSGISSSSEWVLLCLAIYVLIMCSHTSIKTTLRHESCERDMH